MISGDEAKIRILQQIETVSGSISLVHVDDLCRAEVFLAEKEAPAAERYICCSLSTTAGVLARFVSVKYSQYKVRTDRFSGSPEKPRVCMSSAKLVAEGFEYKYKTLDEIYDDVVEYGRALGILPY
ncbi:anthocyanidin reductase ((2S)-flavan-3-ol-forming)-like [Lolium rigidum]|uniref:anthocyanidin reductase ((2S)-flavan-3-ol-forming)-like n=1 Tax=Lolium rigidum TaxID=89674 RepID=UPI001F5C7AB5|nr:anthocyanidin reductase ((2S)-flavan-3-ol-forming)-like [Lolium rigidum]